jgi:hypothetical protein
VAAAYTRSDVTDLLIGDVANAVSSCAPVHGVVDGGRRLGALAVFRPSELDPAALHRVHGARTRHRASTSVHGSSLVLESAIPWFFTGARRRPWRSTTASTAVLGGGASGGAHARGGPTAGR